MKTNEHIIKQFEKVNDDLRKRLMELEAEKQSLEQMFQAQQGILNQRNAVIAELKSELSVKEGLLNIKNGLVEKIYFPCENAKIIEEILNTDTDDIQDDVHRFGVECCQKCIRGKDSENEQKIRKLQSKLDESVEAERRLCEEIEKLEAEKRENRDKIFPYESIEDMKERMTAFENRYQSDCITINQLNVCIDILCEKYSILREIHGHKEDKLCGC